MIRALPTSISLPNGQVQSVLWGLAEKSQQHETIMVGHALKHFRAVDVSVVGVRITEETPYRVSIFEEKNLLMREMLKRAQFSNQIWVKKICLNCCKSTISVCIMLINKRKLHWTHFSKGSNYHFKRVALERRAHCA